MSVHERSEKGTVIPLEAAMAGDVVEQALRKLQEYAQGVDETDPDLRQLVECAFAELAELRILGSRLSQVSGTVVQIRTVPLQVLADIKAHDWAGLEHAA